jgi:hypothetical protein
LKDLTSLKPENWYPCLSNNWLIAQNPTETWDVTEVLWMMPSSMLKTTI